MSSDTTIRTVLSNGFQIRLKQQAQQRTVGLGLFIAHGAKDEDLNTSGIAHYIEHVLFGLNHISRQAKKLFSTLLDAGSLYEAYTSKEYTRVTVTCIPRYLEQAIQLLSLLVSNQRICTKAVEHERSIILHEYAMHFSSSAVLGELLDNAIWGDRSVGLFVIGREDNISRFTKQNFEERVHLYYVPERVHLVAVGPLEIEPFVNLATRYFEPWVSIPHTLPDPVVVTEPRLIALPTGHSRVDLLVGYPGVSFYSSDRYTMELLADILGGGMRSRLFLELREKQKMAYLAYAYAVSYGLGGYLAIRVNCDAAELPKVFTMIQQELERIKTEGVSAAELNRVKATRKTAILRVLENSSQHLQLLGQRAILNNDFFVDLEIHRVEAVRADDVVRMAREIFVLDNLAIVGLGPREEDLLQLI